MVEFVGQVLGDRYIIQSVLGQQKGRRTFLAEDAQTKASVVLKLLLFGPDFTWEDLKLFEREAETLKSLDHAAIPKYLDSFELKTALGDGFVLVQTFIEARSLQSWVTSGRRFSEADIKEIARSLLSILQYLHSRHPAVVHRDIKPSNILLGNRTAHSVGSIYLIDFGSVQVAQHGGTMTVVGTYGYMPPEQFGGRAVPASDLYSLGATLIYLASGQHPADFEYGEFSEALTTLSLSKSFKHWLSHLTQAKASDRIPSAATSLQQLTALPSARSEEKRLIKPTNSISSLKKLPLALKPKLNDFNVIATSEEIELAFLSARIVSSSQAYRQNEVDKAFLSILLLIAGIFFLYVVQSAVMMVLLMVFLLMLRVSKPKPYQIKHKGLAKLVLWFPSGGPLLLSLYDLPSKGIHDASSLREAKRGEPSISYQAVRSIETSIAKDKNMHLISFSLADFPPDSSSQVSEHPYFSIQATPAEVQWLCDHLSQWKGISVSTNFL